MQISGNTILITGGTSGIGLELMKALLPHDNTILICGRREDRLLEIEKAHARVHTFACDVSKKAEREALYAWAVEHHPEVNMLVNNAGIQQDIDFTRGVVALMEREDEIEINLTAPIHLCALFTPHLMEKSHAAILNISSGLAIIPAAARPLYCATKSGLHIFTRCLREQLRDTKVEVYEAIPPAVISELNPESRAGKPTGHMMETDAYAKSVVEGLMAGKEEINGDYVESLNEATMAQVYQTFLDRTRS